MISEELGENYRRLEDGLWRDLMRRCKARATNNKPNLERETARFASFDAKERPADAASV